MPILKVVMARSKARLGLGCAICLARINWQLAWWGGSGTRLITLALPCHGTGQGQRNIWDIDYRALPESGDIKSDPVLFHHLVSIKLK